MSVFEGFDTGIRILCAKRCRTRCSKPKFSFKNWISCFWGGFCSYSAVWCARGHPRHAPRKHKEPQWPPGILKDPQGPPKMREGRFPPFGFEWKGFELWAASLVQFLAFFDFWKMGQKDARGSISPLRVRMEGVWALGGFFDAVFGIFRFLQDGPKRCARVDFPPRVQNGS